ncbi:hypothetical protein OAP43_04055 [Candidatus Pseudothioglobus singularis]|jgi:hypothetical protein|nr:hypothetical protein [Candidatus Pseudothioglobus singularis]MDB4822127.1 hypothetical protein [Candidatus Pseudothioglobus singularis]MDC0596919.1 hypothetical protein [Candidatus Pseudothioglobus singularis]
MGLLDIIASGYLAKRVHNKFNPPQIEVPDDVSIVNIEAKGLGEYTITYKKKGSNSTSVFTISRSIVSRSGGWKFHW